VRFADDRFVFAVGYSNYQVAADDAAHSAAAQKREAAEHLSLGDVTSCSEHLSNASREFLVVRHDRGTLITRTGSDSSGISPATHLLDVMSRV